MQRGTKVRKTEPPRRPGSTFSLVGTGRKSACCARIQVAALIGKDGRMDDSKPRRIGLVGYGMIGGAIGRAARDDGFAEVAFVHGLKRDEATVALPDVPFLEHLSDVAEQEVDLVVEAATAEVVSEIALDVLARRDMLIFTMTALSDDGFREAVREMCRASGTRLYIPHGGILALDGVYDGRSVIEEIKITTTKAPKNLGLEDLSTEGVIYDGPTRDACRLFPRNVNVHACIALCGIGFDRTHSIIIADPATTKMAHVIEVSGDGLEWKIEIAATAGSGVTSVYTPVSGINTVRRVLSRDYDIVLA
jgi:aspartate dehydrogenase